MKSLIILSLTAILSFSAYATTKPSVSTDNPSYEVSILKDGQPLFMQNVIFQDGHVMRMENTKEFSCIKSIDTHGKNIVINPGTIKTGLTFTLKQDVSRHLVQANIESATADAQTASGKCTSVNKENLYREVAIGPKTALKENLGELSGHEYTLLIKRKS